MAFIRIKMISNIPYAYLVESVNTPKGPRQKVREYLGRVYKLENTDGNEVNHSDILTRLVIETLSSYGFRKKGDKWRDDNLVFYPGNLALKKRKKSVVLGVNEGHICEFTLRRIKNFKKGKDPVVDGRRLASYFLEAGLPVGEEEFVKFYQSLR
jgi:hypothetical protein